MSFHVGDVHGVSYDERCTAEPENTGQAKKGQKRRVVSVCDYDAVLIFSRRHNLNPGVMSSARYSAKAFVSTLLGIKTVKQKNGPVKEFEFVNESRRILKTDRCFCNDDGTENLKLKRIEEQLQSAEDTDDREQLQVHDC
jgi:hypothetical protein